MTRRPRVLIVSYHFPPVGGAGVQRIAKFARYLPESNWAVSVLQAANPSVPLLDRSLVAELPAELVIERARTLEPSYAAKQSATTGSGSTARRGGAKQVVANMARLLLQPDAQILWYPDAVRRGRRLLARMPHDAILATAPCYTNLLVGARLAAKSGLPLVCDFRDEWDLTSAYLENAAPQRAARLVQQRMQRAVLRRSAALIATTEASTRQLLSRASEVGGHPIGECIYNGWDAEDLHAASMVAPALPPGTPGMIRVVYTGTLWNLTSIRPFVDAVGQLARERPELVARLEFVCLGRKTPEQREVLEGIRRAGAMLHDLPYADHPTALATMRSADALLLLLSDLPGAERVVPAKLFEYLAVGRQILGILPEGESAMLVRRLMPDAVLHPTDVAGIARRLGRLLQEPAPPESATPPAPMFAFERQALAGQLAKLLTRVSAREAR